MIPAPFLALFLDPSSYPVRLHFSPSFPFHLLASLHHHNVARLVGVVNDGNTDGEMIYRVILAVSELGWFGIELRCSLGWLAGIYGSYLLPKQDGGTSQNEVDPTQL